VPGHRLTNDLPGLVLVDPSFHGYEYSFVEGLRLKSPYSPERLLRYETASIQGVRLPLSTRFLRLNMVSSVFHGPPLFFEYHMPFDEFGVLTHLLTTKHSLLNPARAESTKDELDLLFSVDDQSSRLAALTAVLPWLLAASAWRLTLERLDRRLNRLRTTAMSNPSLKTFKPIPLLRQYVAEVQDNLREIKDSIGEEENQAIAQLQTLAQFRLETLDSIFDTLLKQASALSSKASNEIQLVIGSVTIQVMHLTILVASAPI
jgi:hypothetical protein